ncbi:MAG TPA: universal stress protein [Bacteroidia bacterium]|nr:universal stress protein [Bacteroidia bacterium]
MKTILFPTNFSPGADNALNYAIGLSDKLKAKLILFNSFHIPAYAEAPIDEDVEEQLMNIAEDGLFRLQNNALIQSKNLDVKTMVSYGLAVDNIIETAEEKNVNLIIMGTKGSSGLKEIFIGSNAASVLEKAPCPVLVIPENAKFKTLEKIVFATNFRDSDFNSIASLAEIAALFNSEIMIVHVSQVAPTEDYERDLLQWYKDELKKKANIEYKNISFHDLVGGNVDYELEDFMEKNKVDLLALSMRKRNIFSKLFDRSLSKKMAYHSHTPLLAFHA